MKLKMAEEMLDAPIPGMSLTHELGARPWQQPSQFPTVDDAIEYYMASMTSEEYMEQLIDILEMGVPVTSIANSMQLASVMEGKHTVDVGMLVVPLLMELIMMLGDSAGIEYETGLQNPDANKPRDSQLAKYAMKYKKSIDKVDLEELKEADTEDDKDDEPKGLMARRT
tara:strand:+ start:137 stop:643 length:507 start_codon:yes stop_codon:yes gene_type:complete